MRTTVFGIFGVCFAGLTGCAYDVPVHVEWGPNVTPFLIQLEGDHQQATVNSEEKRIEVQTKALQVWDGRYPTFFVVGGDGDTAVPNLLLSVPKPNELSAPPPNANKARHDAEHSGTRTTSKPR